MYCSDNAEKLPFDNLLSFRLHELVFFWYHSQLASYPYLFASYSYSKILQPYIAATVRMHSDTVLCSTGAPLIKRFIKNSCHLQMVILYKPLSLQIRSPSACKSALMKKASSFRTFLLMYISYISYFCFVSLKYTLNWQLS